MSTSLASLCHFSFDKDCVKSKQISYGIIKKIKQKHNLRSKKKMINVTLKIVSIENCCYLKEKMHHEYKLILTDNENEIIAILRNNDLKLIGNDIITINQYELVDQKDEKIIVIITYKYEKHE